MPLELLFAAGGYGLFVFFKAFQQRNVAFLHYGWVMPVSYVMSFTDVAVMSVVAYKVSTEGITWDLVFFGLAIGTGGGLGAMASMKIHERYLTR
jgi:hypothetical protein